MSVPHPAASESQELRDDEAYRFALDFLFERINYERVPHDSYTVEHFKLDRMRALLAALGDPQTRIPAIHIAGTKGKGSTASMLAAMLQAAGVRTGLFTSPHLADYRERITVNGIQIPREELIRHVETLKPVVAKIDRDRPELGPTFFELTTALSWLHYEAAQVELAVLEAGLGGRLDSTNVCNPIGAVITSISRDHTRLLGNTLEQIAMEKAGIFKAGVPALSGVTQPEPARAIRKTAQGVGAPLAVLEAEISVRVLDASGQNDGRELRRCSIETSNPWGRHDRLECPLPGVHQSANLALAAAAFDLASTNWRPLKAAAMGDGLKSVHWPLRIQQMATDPRVIIDGAHNDASVRALCDALGELHHTRRILIFATSRDKEARDMLRIMGPHFDTIILTRYAKNPRALPLDELVQAADGVIADPKIAADPTEAWQTARSLAAKDDLICIAGSLFLAAEMEPIVKAHPH
jgi:dihydrofolate synthase/folylpolyglutamate synthase